MQKIHTGEVSMKPKAYFVLSMVALVGLVLLILVTTVLFVSYTLFSLVVSGHMLLLGFGWRGVEAFVMLFPWITFVIDIVLLVALDALVRKFAFGYKRPIVLLVFGTTVILVFLGYIVSVTSFHGALLHRAEQRQLPPSLSPMVGPFYDHIRTSHRENGVVQGTVTSIAGNMFTIDHDDYDAEPDDATTTIIAPLGTDISTFLHIGDHVLVGGDILPDGSVHAYGVTKFDKNL